MNKLLIGGSDIGALLGQNPHKSAIDVYNRIVHGIEQPAGRPAMRGIKLEPAILSWWADENNMVVISPKNPWKDPSQEDKQAIRTNVCGETDVFRWSLDGLTDRNEVVEVKTVSWNARHEWEDGPPSWYVSQCQWYMHWVDSPRCNLVKFDGNDISTIIIERDIELGKSLVQKAQEFWDNHVVTKIPPPPDGSAAYTEHQKRIERKAGVLQDNSEELTELLRQHQENIAHKEIVERKIEIVRQRLIEYMGPDHDVILSNNGKISFKEQSRKTVDWEQIAVDLGATSDRIAKHTTVKKHRVFKVYQQRKTGLNEAK